MAHSSDSPELLIALHRTDSTFEEIPVINIQDARSSDPIARKKLADLIRDACINVGFFYIESHGIPREVIDNTISAGKEYFALPEETKMQLDIHKSAKFKGYTALLGENTDPTGRGDLHEAFDIGWEGAVSEGDGDLGGGNVWPEDMPEFKRALTDYYQKTLEVGNLLFPLFALALDLPETFFDNKTNKSAAIMRVLHYPPQNATSSEGDDGKQIGIGAHTDYECFTILWQDEAGGLQVRNALGEWVDAVPISGSLVVNLGDQFARWTNDIFKSTLHRVINRSGAERYSIPMFFGTNYDVLLETIPTCVTPGMPSKYEVVTAGEYVKSRLEATYAHSAL